MKNTINIFLWIIYFISFIIIIPFVGCSDNSVNPKSENLQGLFVVDSFNIKLNTQRQSDNDSLFGSIAYGLKYHFENQPGTIQNLGISIQDSIGRIVYIDYAFPKPINEPGYLGESFELLWFNLNTIDSIKFDIFISGAFWNYNFKTSKMYGFLGEFNWSEHKWFKIPK